MTPFLPISTALDPKRLENTRLRYGDKKFCRIFVGKIFETHNMKHYELHNFVNLLYS